MTTQNTSPISPSRDYLRIISVILVIVGLCISGYLTYIKLNNAAPVCIEGGGFNCDIVIYSAYSRFMGWDVAYWGFVSNVILLLLLIFENKIGLLRAYGVMLGFGFTLFLFMFSMWLVYVQFFILEALCPWCLSHEAYLTALFVIASIRLTRVLNAPVEEAA